MRGLDPRIHDEAPYWRQYWFLLSQVTMDCRVKPGNDLLRGDAKNSEVMRGLDPRIRDEAPYWRQYWFLLSQVTMDFRAKPGNDLSRGDAKNSESCAGLSRASMMMGSAEGPFKNGACRAASWIAGS